MDRKSYLLLAIFLFVALLSLETIVFDITIKFKIFLIFYLIILFLAINTMVDTVLDRKGGSSSSAFLFVLLIVFGLYGYFELGFENTSLLLLIVSVVGFFISIANIESLRDYNHRRNTPPVTLPKLKAKPKKAVTKAVKKTKKVSRKSNFIANKNTKTYHVATCAVAKMISGKNKDIVNTKQQARSRKYKAHSCVK